MSHDFAASRRHPRVALRVPVDITTIDAETDPRTGRPYFRACRELCANLSHGGLFIASSDPPGPGRRLLVRIHPEDGTPPIEAIGRVAWQKLGGDAPVREPGAGVEFVIESPLARAAIDRMLARAAAEPPPEG